MTLDIFIKSFPKDYGLLEQCLASIRKHCRGHRRIVVVVPSRPLPLLVEHADVLWITVPDREPGYMWQQVIKMHSDEYTDADWICHVDSDCLFVKDVDLTELCGHWLYTPYVRIETPWQKPTEAFLGKPVLNEFMRRFPITIPRWLYRDARQFKSDEWIMKQSCFSEFNALGAVAWDRWREQFKWQNTVDGVPERVLEQRESWRVR